MGFRDIWTDIAAQLEQDRKRPWERTETTALETREATQPPARAKLNGRVGQVTGTPRGVDGAIGRSLARDVGRLGLPDGVVHLLFADVCSLIIGGVCALDGGGEV
jgi:hypothetical protein